MDRASKGNERGEFAGMGNGMGGWCMHAWLTVVNRDDKDEEGLGIDDTVFISLLGKNQSSSHHMLTLRGT